MNTTDAQIRAWSARHGQPISETEPIPDTIRERYRQARAYMIRRNYARKKARQS